MIESAGGEGWAEVHGETLAACAAASRCAPGSACASRGVDGLTLEVQPEADATVETELLP